MGQQNSTNDQEPDDPQAGPEETNTEDDRQSAESDKDKAPWERNGAEFDPETAWKLIQNLKDEVSGLKAEKRQREDETLTESQKAQRDLKEALEENARLKADNAWATAMAAHPQLKPEDRELIGNGAPEEIAAKAAKLAVRYAAQATAQTQNTNPLNAKPTGGTDPTKPSRHTDWIREALDN